MTTFRPRKRPLWNRILLSPTFHVFVIIISVCVVIVYVYQKERANTRFDRQTFANLKETRAVQRRPETVSEQASALGDSPPSVASTAPTHSSGGTFGKGPEAPSPTAEGSSKEGLSERSASNVAPSKSYSRLEVVFVEINRKVFEEILTRIKSKMVYATWSAGVIPDFDTIFKDIKNQYHLEILQQSNQKISVGGEASRFHQGTQDVVLGKEVGLSFQVEVSAAPSVNLQVQVKIELQLKEIQGEEVLINTQNFQEEFDLPANSGIFFSGLIPHRPAYEDEKSSFGSSFLKIMKSPEFQKNETELLVFLVPR